MALEIPIAPKLKQWLPFWGVRPQGGAVQKRTGRTGKLFWQDRTVKLVLTISVRICRLNSGTPGRTDGLFD